MKVRVKLRELKDASAEYVSLVTAGANRIPFRMVKTNKGEDMIDLTSFKQVFARKAEAEKKPQAEITTLGVMKGDEKTFAAVKAAIAASGFTVEQVTENDDGSVAIVQKAEVADSEMVKVSDNLVVVVAGGLMNDAQLDQVLKADKAITAALEAIAKAPNDLGDQSKTGTLTSQTGGAADGVAKPTTTGAEGTKASDPAINQPKPNATLNAPEGFDRGVWEGMTEGQKLAVLKMKGDMPPWIKDKPAAGAAADPEDAKDGGADDATEAADGTKKPAAACKDDAKLKAEKDAAEAAKKSEADAAAVLKAEQDQALAGKIEAAVKAAIEPLQTQLKEVAAKADTAEKAVKGTVTAAPTAEDIPLKDATAKKADADPRTGCFDTAFIKKADTYGRAYQGR